MLLDFQSDRVAKAQQVLRKPNHQHPEGRAHGQGNRETLPSQRL